MPRVKHKAEDVIKVGNTAYYIGDGFITEMWFSRLRKRNIYKVIEFDTYDMFEAKVAELKKGQKNE